MTIRPLILADLDDSLFQTRPKCGDWPDETLRLMSRLVDGSPSGYATPPQQGLMAWLAHGEVVPVTARSRAGLRLSEVFAALFPCGSVTGAPKRQAMHHIARLERSARGVYCGAVGLMAPGGRVTHRPAPLAV